MKTKDMVLIAMFAILTAVGALISIPIPPVPVTLQYLMAMLTGAILGARRGAMAQILYVFMGLIGLPVFAGGTGGIGHVLSPTFGYLIGFILCAFIVGLVSDRVRDLNAVKLFAGGLLGLAVTYIAGVLYLYAILNTVADSSISLMGAIQVGFLPFVIKDTVMTAVGVFVIRAVVPRLEQSKVLEARA